MIPARFDVGELDPEVVHGAISQYFQRVVLEVLARFRGTEAEERQRQLANRLIAALGKEVGESSLGHLDLVEPLRRLLAVHATPEPARTGRPDTPLARSALLTGTRLDPALGVQLRKKIAAADHVDTSMSWSTSSITRRHRATGSCWTMSGRRFCWV